MGNERSRASIYRWRWWKHWMREMITYRWNSCAPASMMKVWLPFPQNSSNLCVLMHKISFGTPLIMFRWKIRDKLAINLDYLAFTNWLEAWKIMIFLIFESMVLSIQEALWCKQGLFGKLRLWSLQCEQKGFIWMLEQRVMSSWSQHEKLTLYLEKISKFSIKKWLIISCIQTWPSTQNLLLIKKDGMK